MTRPQRAPKQLHLESLPPIHPNAAAIDIGADEMLVAVPSDRDAEPVRAFPTFTQELQTLLAWLLACRIDTVALESTGVYWIPIDELLWQHGITPDLVTARQVKTVPGRKSDWNDAQYGGDYVFTSEQGGPHSPRNIYRGFKAALKRAKLPMEMTFHDLRHCAGSVMLANGEDIEAVRELLGHSSRSVTEKSMPTHCESRSAKPARALATC